MRIYGSENKFNFNRWTKYIFLGRVIYIVEKTEGIMSKKKSRVIKVNVIYGDKNLKDCMEQVIRKHERSFDLLTLTSLYSILFLNARIQNKVS